MGQYCLDRTRGILTKNGEKLRHDHVCFAGHVRKGRRWFCVIKIWRGPLLVESVGYCEERAEERFKELASQLRTGHSDKGQSYLLDTHSKLRTVKGYGSLDDATVVRFYEASTETQEA